MKTKNKHHDLISLNETWHQWWEIFSQHFVKWITISFTPWFLTYLIIALIAGNLIMTLKKITYWSELFSLQSSSTYIFIACFILILLLQIFGSLILIFGISKKELNIKETFTGALKFFWNYFVLTIILGLVSTIILSFGYFITALITGIIGLINVQMVDQLFYWLQLIPLLAVPIASIYLIFSPYCLVNDKKGPFQAIKQSFFLVHKHFWPTLLRLSIIYVIVISLALMLSFIPWIGSTIAVIISSPMIAIYSYIIYKDLKQFKTT